MGDIVSTEHIVYGVCTSAGQDSHVCTRDKIIGIGQDGASRSTSGFLQALWPTNVDLIRPEVGASRALWERGARLRVVSSRQDGGHSGLRDHRPLRHLDRLGMGADHQGGAGPPAKWPAAWGAMRSSRPTLSRMPAPLGPRPDRAGSDPHDGIGVDVAMEMAGFNSSLNNAIQMTRRGETWCSLK